MATIKSGFLLKLSGLLKRDWKRRYFVLYQDGELVYYEGPTSQTCDGKVNVRNSCQRIDYAFEVEQDIQQRASGRVNCLFRIRSSVKNITVLADNEQDARDWVQKLNETRQSTHTMMSGVPGNAYPGYQPAMPYPNSQAGVPYPTNQPAIGYPGPGPQCPPVAAPYPTQGGMPQPYPVGVTYPGQPQPYIQPMGTQPPPMYGQYPGYQGQPPPAARYNYPAYQQQQYQQAPQSRGGLSSRRGLFAGAAGGALAGGLLGYGMGRAVGGFGDSFDGDCCDFDCD